MLTGKGKGPSKKKAKHNAASRLLCAMHGINCVLDDESGEEVSDPAADQTEVTTNGLPEYVGLMLEGYLFHWVT